MLGGVALLAAPEVVSLSSGERLVGEVLPQSNEHTLVLQSALLGELRLPRAQIVQIEAQAKPAPVVDAEVARRDALGASVSTAAVVEMVEQEQAIIDRMRELRAPESWSGNLRMGMNLSGGDRRYTETALRGKLEIEEPGSAHFYRLSGAYTYRETERANGSSFISTDRYDGTFIYRRSVGEEPQNWFIQNAFGARVDRVKGIDREYQDTIGIGYQFSPLESFEFLLGGGGGVEDFQAAFDDSRTGVNPVMNVFQEVTWRPLARTALVQKLNYYWNPELSSQYNYVLSAALRVRLTDLFGLEFSYDRNYDNDLGNGEAKDDAVWRNALVVYF
jgi:putative salt-induced outer membrane protein YdiY